MEYVEYLRNTVRAIALACVDMERGHAKTRRYDSEDTKVRPRRYEGTTTKKRKRDNEKGRRRRYDNEDTKVRQTRHDVYRVIITVLSCLRVFVVVPSYLRCRSFVSSLLYLRLRPFSLLTHSNAVAVTVFSKN